MFITYKTYIVINKLTGGIYIGCTKESKEARWESHVKKSKNPSAKFHKAIQKYGEENFSIRYLQTYLSEKDMLNGEIRYIRYFNSNSDNNYNSTIGGEGGATNTGKVFSSETKLKMHQASVGQSKNYRKSSDEEEKEIVEYYNQQLSLKDIANRMKKSKTTIIDILERKKVYIKSTKSKPNGRNLYTLVMEKQITADYKTGQYSYTDLGKKYAINGKNTKANVISAIIKRNE